MANGIISLPQMSDSLSEMRGFPDRGNMNSISYLLHFKFLFHQKCIGILRFIFYDLRLSQ